MQWQMASPFSILYSDENAPRSGLPSEYKCYCYHIILFSFFYIDKLC